MEVTGEIQQICSELLERYKQAIKNNGHEASGKLESTASYKININGRYVEVIFNLEEYWKYLENGTQPHFPPVDAIEKWITVKHIIPTTNTGKVPTTRQLAYLIARGISEHGTKGTKLLQQTLEASDDLISQLADAIAKELENELNEEEI